MKSEYVLLGKSSFAIAIIVDILKTKYNVSSVDIVSNIEDAENDSLIFDYKINDVVYNEYSHEEYQFNENSKVVIASIGKSRKKIYDFFKKIYPIEENNFIDIVHPSALITSEVKHGYGFHLSPMSQVSPFTTIGNFVVINRKVSIGHHNIIEDFVTINPGVNIAGCCRIEENTVIGLGTTVLDKVTIGKNTIIGAGSVVTRSIPDNVIAYGSPAKIIRENK